MKVPTAKNVLSIDIGGSKIIVGIVNSNGEIVVSQKKELPNVYNEAYLLQEILSMAKNFESYSPSICGIAIPGLVHQKSGDWLYAPFSNIGHFPISSLIQERLQIPTFADNDVNVCALGEKIFGKCKNKDDFVWLTVSNGVGGALFLNGKPYYGVFGNAGEIGHFYTQEANDKRCGCGKYGCLETIASGYGIQRHYHALTGKDVSAKDIASMARAGDSYALKTFSAAATALGKALSYTVNLLNIDTVVLGGGVGFCAFDLLLPYVQESIDNHRFNQAFDCFNIIQTGLGYHAALIGAAALALYKTQSTI